MGTEHQRHDGEEKPRSPPVLLAASPGIATSAPSAPPVLVSSEGLRGAGAPVCRGEVPERDRREGASPTGVGASRPGGCAMWLRQGAAAAGTTSGAGSCSISSGERAACCSHGRKAPFWAASSPLGWKAPPELVLQVSSFCFFWETDFFHVRGIQIGSKLLRILFVHRSIQAWPFTVLL